MEQQEEAVVGTEGKHIIAELSECTNLSSFDDCEQMQSLLRRSAEAGRATVLKTESHKFSPQGVSGLAFLAESHVSIHAYPEYGYASVDCYTCGDKVDTDAIFRNLAEELGAQHTHVTVLHRGLRFGTLFKHKQELRLLSGVEEI